MDYIAQKKEQKIERKKDGFAGQHMVYIPIEALKVAKSDPVISDLYLTHIGIFPSARGQYRNRPNGCDQFILFYCTHGSGWIKVDGIDHTLTANQLFIIEQNRPCSYGSSDQSPWTNYWIHFQGKHSRDYSPKLNTVINLSPSSNSRIGDRLKIFEEILQCVENSTTRKNIVYANVLLKQFLTSVTLLQQFRQFNEIDKDELFWKAKSILHSRINGQISLKDVAASCNCSISNLNKVFKRETNTSPINYFLGLKMQRACRLLAHSALRIKEIASSLGFEDPYYFSRLFTKYIGVSPRQYRKMEDVV